MREMARKFIVKHASAVCTLTAIIATVSVNGCRNRWYQPEEPDGLDEIAARVVAKNKIK